MASDQQSARALLSKWRDGSISQQKAYRSITNSGTTIFCLDFAEAYAASLRAENERLEKALRDLVAFHTPYLLNSCECKACSQVREILASPQSKAEVSHGERQKQHIPAGQLDDAWIADFAEAYASSLRAENERLREERLRLKCDALSNELMEISHLVPKDVPAELRTVSQRVEAHVSQLEAENKQLQRDCEGKETWGQSWKDKSLEDSARISQLEEALRRIADLPDSVGDLSFPAGIAREALASAAPPPEERK